MATTMQKTATYQRSAEFCEKNEAETAAFCDVLPANLYRDTNSCQRWRIALESVEGSATPPPPHP